ncbi:hypothetical protein ACSBR1_009378 [Camellia fascicularis]
MGRMKFIWGEDWVEFKPERWLSKRGTIKHEPSYKFVAFNAGLRTCLGKEVAFTQMKAVSAAIINNYNVRVVEGYLVVPNASIILCMKHGLKSMLAPAHMEESLKGGFPSQEVRGKMTGGSQPNNSSLLTWFSLSFMYKLRGGGRAEITHTEQRV